MSRYTVIQSHSHEAGGCDGWNNSSCWSVEITVHIFLWNQKSSCVVMRDEFHYWCCWAKYWITVLCTPATNHHESVTNCFSLSGRARAWSRSENCDRRNKQVLRTAVTLCLVVGRTSPPGLPCRLSGYMQRMSCGIAAPSGCVEQLIFVRGFSALPRWSPAPLFILLFCFF